MKDQITNQIRIIEDQINKIEESVGNYPTEEKQIELNLLYTELNQLKQKNIMKDQIESIRSAENQAKMFEMITELAIEISKTDTNLLSINKQWINYGTWRSNCFANEFQFGKDLAEALMSKLSKRITHDENLNFHIGDFIDEIEEAIYEVL